MLRIAPPNSESVSSWLNVMVITEDRDYLHRCSHIRLISAQRFEVQWTAPVQNAHPCRSSCGERLTTGYLTTRRPASVPARLSLH